MKSEKEEEEGRKRKKGGGGSSLASAPPDKQQLVFTVRHTTTEPQTNIRLSYAQVTLAPPPPKHTWLGGGNNDRADVPTTDCPDDELTSPDQAGN